MESASSSLRGEFARNLTCGPRCWLADEDLRVENTGYACTFGFDGSFQLVQAF